MSQQTDTKLVTDTNYQKHKDYMKEKVICEICNHEYSRVNKSHHIVTTRHKAAEEFYNFTSKFTSLKASIEEFKEFIDSHEKLFTDKTNPQNNKTNKKTKKKTNNKTDNETDINHV